MNPQTLLDNLAPLRSPNPVGWWPLAPGWWLLIGLASLALLTTAIWLWRRRAANHYRRVALQTLARLESEGTDTAELNRLLKATALQVYGKQVAALSGDAWVAFLETHCESVDRQALAALANVYGPEAAQPSADTIAAARHWIRRHEVADV